MGVQSRRNSQQPADLSGGFIYRKGRYTPLDTLDGRLTGHTGINNRGDVVGSYVDADGREHGFLLERGRMTVIDHPDSPDHPAATNTAASDINDRGQIVGYYADANGTYHGYLYHKGRFTRIDPPGAADVAGFATTARPWASTTAARWWASTWTRRGCCTATCGSRDVASGPSIPLAVRATPAGKIPNVGRVCGTVAADINDREQILLPAPGTFSKGRAVPIGG